MSYYNRVVYKIQILNRYQRVRHGVLDDHLLSITAFTQGLKEDLQVVFVDLENAGVERAMARARIAPLLRI